MAVRRSARQGASRTTEVAGEEAVAEGGVGVEGGEGANWVVRERDTSEKQSRRGEQDTRLGACISLPIYIYMEEPNQDGLISLFCYCKGWWKGLINHEYVLYWLVLVGFLLGESNS
ncbi:uncharacterized protein [Elaeis guineensis]|uniref:uncharacterized protein n=1 Tax=Elaeis guineensis var. tenera TaxID=51953 RepID=UPI003C6D0B98